MTAPVPSFPWCHCISQQFVSIALKNPNNSQADLSWTTDEMPNIIDDKEKEVLIIVSIETLKRQKSKCGKDEVFIGRYKLVKDTIEVFLI